MSDCYVRENDYTRYWLAGSTESVTTVTAITGAFVERRTGPKDRRTHGHERRWEASRGRRFRLKDRRRG